MLNLIYYDLTSTIKKLWIYIVFMAILSFIVRLIWSGMFTENLNNDINNFYITAIINYVALSALGVITFIVSMAIIVTQTKWFDENLLSPQGQLTNMLPVSSHQLMLSKVLTALFWSIILVLMTIGVLSIFLVNTERYNDIMSAITEIGTSNNINISMAQIIISVALFIITSVTTIVTTCFVSQLTGQMFNKFRNFMTLIAFISLIFIACMFIHFFSSILGMSVTDLTTDIDSIINFSISSAAKLSFVNIFIIAIYWLIGSFILKNHLNFS
jgi:ABC transporter permease protein